MKRWLNLAERNFGASARGLFGEVANCMRKLYIFEIIVLSDRLASYAQPEGQ
jgi:hypothetical protein